MRTLLLAIAAFLQLQGCASWMLKEHIRNSQGRDDTVVVKPAAGMHRVLCPRVGESDHFRIDAQGLPLYLNTRSWTISDVPPEKVGSPTPGNQAKMLEVVFGNSPGAYFPSDLESPWPSVFIQVPDSKTGLGADSGLAVGADGLKVLYCERGAIQWSHLGIRTDGLIRRRARARAIRSSPWFFLTVPLDILLSPVELPLYLLVKRMDGYAVIGCTGSGCH